MTDRVKLTCEGRADARHPRLTLAAYDYSAALGWRRVERFTDRDDVRHLSDSDGWAANTPGARYREVCGKCGQTPVLTWETLSALLDDARASGRRRVTIARRDEAHAT